MPSSRDVEQRPAETGGGSDAFSSESSDMSSSEKSSTVADAAADCPAASSGAPHAVRTAGLRQRLPIASQWTSELAAERRPDSSQCGEFGSSGATVFAHRL